jgi:hypothetical protein
MINFSLVLSFYPWKRRYTSGINSPVLRRWQRYKLSVAGTITLGRDWLLCTIWCTNRFLPSSVFCEEFSPVRPLQITLPHGESAQSAVAKSSNIVWINDKFLFKEFVYSAV